MPWSLSAIKIDSCWRDIDKELPRYDYENAPSQLTVHLIRKPLYIHIYTNIASFCVNFITFSLRKLQRFSRMFAESLISFSQLIAETFIIVSLSVFSLRLFRRLASFLVSRPWRRYRTFTVRRRRRWRKKTAEPYCPICLQDAAEGEKMRRLTACGHCFHAECIDPWLEKRSTCPQCRAQIPPVPPEYPLVALFVPPGVIELFTKEP
ncbi:hypothetical protein YC2023_056104 [Brassica napus]